LTRNLTMESDKLEQIKQLHLLRNEWHTKFEIIAEPDLEWLIEEVERLRGIVGYIPLEEGDDGE